MFGDNMTAFSAVALLLLSVSYEFANTNKINLYGVLLVVIGACPVCDMA